jgi:hypothetical protein
VSLWCLSTDVSPLPASARSKHSEIEAVGVVAGWKALHIM